MGRSRQYLESIAAGIQAELTERRLSGGRRTMLQWVSSPVDDCSARIYGAAGFTGIEAAPAHRPGPPTFPAASGMGEDISVTALFRRRHGPEWQRMGTSAAGHDEQRRAAQLRKAPTGSYYCGLCPAFALRRAKPG
jgi:hypothetical protein